MTNKSLTEQAKALRDIGEFKEASELYDRAWNQSREDWNNWELFYYAHSLRKVGRFTDALEICREIWRREDKFEPANNLYSWLIYDTEIKQDQISNQATFLRAAKGILKLTKQDRYSPYTKTVFKAVEVSKAANDWRKVLEWLSLLDSTALSRERAVFSDSRGEAKTYPSEVEKYYNYLTEIQFKLGQWEECIKTSKEALGSDVVDKAIRIWISRRLAKSYLELGNLEEAKQILEELIKVKPDWFLKDELAQIYLKMGDRDRAMNLAMRAALDPGDPEHKVKLYVFLAKLLVAEGRLNEGKAHAELATAVRIYKGWKIEKELESLMSSLGVDVKVLRDYQTLLKVNKKTWESFSFQGQEALKGTIKKLLPNNKSGFILGEDEKSYFFGLRDFKGKKDLVQEGLNVRFYTAVGFDKKKNCETQIAVHILPVR